MKAHFILFLISLFLFSMCTPVENTDWEDGRWIDLTHNFSEETLFWPTAETFQLDTVSAGMTDAGFYYEAYSFCAAEHGGTHLDAPIHFSEGKKSVHELDINQLTGRAVVIDVTAKVEENRDYQIRPGDITSWEDEYGELPDDIIILFYTGMSAHWPDAESYLGTANRGEEALEELSFPGIHPETAEWIVANRTVKAVGLDTPSLDFGQSEMFETHQILFEEEIPGFENVANLEQLPTTGAYIIALPMKIENGSGAPLRIVAHLSE